MTGLMSSRQRQWTERRDRKAASSGQT